MNIPMITNIPIGFIKIAEDKSPCNKCNTERVVPQEGQGSPTAFFNTQISRPGLDC